MERQLLTDYERRIICLLPALTEENLDRAVDYASVPQMIRGFGHVKGRTVSEAKARYKALEETFFMAHPVSIAGE